MAFSIPKPQNFSEVLEKAKVLAAKNGANLSGDNQSGHFEVKNPAIAGTYQVSGDTLSVIVTKKPFFIPEVMIKAKLEEFLK